MALPKETITAIGALFSSEVPDAEPGQDRESFRERFIFSKDRQRRFGLREYRNLPRMRKTDALRSISLEVFDPEERKWWKVMVARLNVGRPSIAVESSNRGNG